MRSSSAVTVRADGCSLSPIFSIRLGNSTSTQLSDAFVQPAPGSLAPWKPLMFICDSADSTAWSELGVVRDVAGAGATRLARSSTSMAKVGLGCASSENRRADSAVSKKLIRSRGRDAISLADWTTSNTPTPSGSVLAAHSFNGILIAWRHSSTTIRSPDTTGISNGVALHVSVTCSRGFAFRSTLVRHARSPCLAVALCSSLPARSLVIP